MTLKQIIKEEMALVKSAILEATPPPDLSASSPEPTEDPGYYKKYFKLIQSNLPKDSELYRLCTYFLRHPNMIGELWASSMPTVIGADKKKYKGHYDKFLDSVMNHVKISMKWKPDPIKDQQLLDAWNSGSQEMFESMAQSLGTSLPEARQRVSWIKMRNRN